MNAGMPLRVEIPEKMHHFFPAKRYKIARGGRGGGKSWAIARLLLAKGFAGKAVTDSEGNPVKNADGSVRKRGLRILCGREIQKSLKQSVYKLLCDQIRAMGLEWFYDTQRDVIKGRNGTEFSFTGLQGHTMDSLKSYESVDICWIEEAHSVSSDSWRVLIPTIRAPGSEIWASFNPDTEDDEVYARFVTRLGGGEVVAANDCEYDASGNVDWSLRSRLGKTGAVRIAAGVLETERAVVVEINWRDNPWFTREADDERLELKALNDDLYQHVWEGKCRSAAGLMFKRHWFRRYDRAPDLEYLNVYMASDYAVTEDGGDFTVHGVFGIDSDGAMWVLDWWYGQTAPEAWVQAAAVLVKRWKPLIWFDENGTIRNSQNAAIERRLLEIGCHVWRVGLTSTGNKAARAMGFAGRSSAGQVWVPAPGREIAIVERNGGVGGIPGWADRLVNQLCGFTGQPGKVDDDVDVCSLISRGLDQTKVGLPAKAPEKSKIPAYGTAEWLEWADRKGELDAAVKARYYA